jgi:hypothetical protein
MYEPITAVDIVDRDHVVDRRHRRRRHGDGLPGLHVGSCSSHAPRSPISSVLQSLISSFRRSLASPNAVLLFSPSVQLAQVESL